MEMQTAESGVSGNARKLTLIRLGQRIFMLLLGAALFALLPLAMKDGYSGIGDFKYEIFKNSALALLPVLLLLYAAEKYLTGERESFGVLDKWVAVYLAAAALSFLLAQDKSAAFYGAPGWHMGLLSQLLFVGIYAVASRMWKGGKLFWYGACGAALLVFCCGILHRFQIDPIGVYAGLTQDQRLRFLSTLGQATWYSSYVCTVFPLGLFLFWKSDRISTRVLAGLFSAAAFATIVTQNSDSTFAALLVILCMLFFLAFDSGKTMGRFLEVLMLLLFSFEVVGFLQNLFPDKAVRLDSLSVFASQSIVTGVSLLAVCALYAWYSTKGFAWLEREARFTVRRIGLLLGLLTAVGAIFVMAGNTAGILGDALPKSGYLYFDGQWGSGRGRTWQFAAQAFAGLPPWRKLFGVGPDCFSSYFYSIPEYAERLSTMWGADTLANAHNEWLNALLCYGLVGAVSYFGIFASGIRAFFKNRGKAPMAVAAALCAGAYMGHNLFCYQQALCTPLVFFILGMGTAHLRKSGIK